MDPAGPTLRSPLRERGERRARRRVRTRIDVAYEDAERQVFLRAVDLSETGIFLLAPDPPPRGRSAALVLELPGHAEILRLRGVVARIQREPRTGFALRFERQAISPTALAALRRFVHAAVSRDRDESK